MDKLYLSCIFLLFFTHSYSVHAQNTPCNAEELVAGQQGFTSYDNSGNSESGVETTYLMNYASPDYWFSFKVGAEDMFLFLKAKTMTNPALAVYKGTCDNLTLIYNVLDNNCNGENQPEILFDELVDGETYWVRVYPENGTPNGEFKLLFTETPEGNTSFDVFADSEKEGDCIRLTEAKDGKLGCSFYQIPINFSEPFTHRATMNFGNQLRGADGICLVYQSNTPSTCGERGGGLGARDLPNSAIFEFDTYYNPSIDDPREDHTAFNINGVLDHTFSIEGPVTLGNIEDGQDHDMEFSWDPSSNHYTLKFDGNTVLEGNYDIINNCFGGQDIAYWGFTASTGAENNNQSVCPEISEEYFPSKLRYEEVEICKGDSYKGYTEEGFYTYKERDANGCETQYHVRLNIIPFEDILIDTVICRESFPIEIRNNIYQDEGVFSTKEENMDGCERDVTIGIDALDVEIDITSDPITCSDEEVFVTARVDIDIAGATATSFSWDTPSGIRTGSEILVDQPGIYTLTVIISIGDLECVFTKQHEVTIDKSLPDIQVAEDTIVVGCDKNIFDYYFEILNDFGSNISIYWEYQGDIVGRNKIQTVLGEGQYTFHFVNDDNGCLGFINVTVIIDDGLDPINISHENLNCLHTSTSPTVDIPREATQWEWTKDGTFFSSEKSPEITEAGTYTFTISNDEGCTIDTSIVVEIDTLSPDLEVEDILLPCDSTTATLHFDYNDQYEVNITGPDTFNDPKNPTLSTPGTYTVTVTNLENGCTTEKSFQFDFIGMPPDIALSADTLTCETKEITISNGINNNRDYTYKWTLRGNEVSTDSLATIDEPGVYVLTVTTQDGCIDIDSIEINQDILAPNIQTNDITIGCDVGQGEISVDKEKTHTITWEGPTDIEDGTVNTTVSNAGTYYITVTNPQNGCTTLDSIRVTNLGNSPQFEIDSQVITCFNPSAKLSVLSNDNPTIQWEYKNNAIGNTEAIEVDQAGWYKVTLTSETGCISTDSVKVEVDTIHPVFSLTADTIVCQDLNASVSIVENVGDSIFWTGPNGFTSIKKTFSTVTPGTYTVTVTNPENGCSTIHSIVVESTVQNLPEVNISEDTLNCTQPEINLDISIDGNYESIQWVGPNGFQSNEMNPLVDEAGAYRLSIDLGEGCIIDTVVNISEDFRTPTFELYAEEITCDNREVNIQFDNTSGLNVDVTIEDPDGNRTQNTQLTATKGGTYIYTATGDNGCHFTDSITIIEHTDIPEVKVAAISHLGCTKKSGSINIESKNNNNAFQWIGPNGFTSTNEDIIVSDTGTYSVTVTNQYGCSTSFEKKIKDNTRTPEVDLSADTLNCANNEVSIFAQSNDVFDIHQWFFGGNLFSSEKTARTSKPGTYIYVGLTEEGCEGSDTLEVISNPGIPEIHLLSPPQIISYREVPNIKISTEVFSELGYTVKWTPSKGLSCDDCLSPTIIGSTEESYTMTVTNRYGCTSSIRITVIHKKKPKVYIPSAISPNSDHNNDYFTIFTNESIKIVDDMRIYDRWGQLLFSKKDFEPNKPEIGWNGKDNGQPVSIGVYAYIIKVTDVDGRTKIYKGDFKVLR